MCGGNLIPSKNGDVIEMLDVYLQFSASKNLLAPIEVLTIYCPNNLLGITQITQVFQDTDIG
ncbi:hypothetical protein Hanom_Chr13g01212191 [Helianthus anomalus]